MNTLEITVQWDGGCSPNPGNKYGSYRILWNDKPVLWDTRFSLGVGTNNEAEFEALEKALGDLCARFNQRGKDMSKFSLKLLTDSMVVRYRLDPNRKAKKEKGEAAKRMAALADRIRSTLKLFGGYTINWNSRERNVEAFGH